MKNHYLLLLALFFCLQFTFAQKQTLTYFLPDLEYNKTIPSPEEFLGWQLGEWHISHDLQQSYMRLLARLSPRMTLTEYARTHEQRPLLYLTVTSVDNHKNIDNIQAQHLALNDPDRSADMNVADMPLVLYQGFSIHGNEPSGGNAAVLLAYYLAAAPDTAIKDLLDNTVILLDPCYNPDGFNRFATWANMHKNKSLTSDNEDREYHEAWPGGRTNHYWFDLNRDWFPVQHPESRGRINTFYAWKPNVLTDHHEMGTNATFFFMPGEPSRVHPLTPEINQELTKKIGAFHAAAFDKIGTLYYSEEGYDDFYMGKGSTYPDVNACIGILFEQASSRGHLQQSDNGLLTFPYTIRNQVTAGMSTYAAVVDMKDEILNFQRQFYVNAKKEARNDKRYGYVFGTDNDPNRSNHFIDILLEHQIEVYPLKDDVQIKGQVYQKNNAYVIPLAQNQYRFIKGLFDPLTTFEDSLFYDVSTWTLPMAFNLPYHELTSKPTIGNVLKKVPGIDIKTPALSEYAYALPWDDFYAPRVAYRLMDAGLRLKVATEASVVNGRKFGPGMVFLPIQNQSLDKEAIHDLVVKLVQETKVQVYALSTGLSSEGPDLGSRKYHTMEKPSVAIIIGSGITSYEAGSNWFLLDQRYRIPVTKLDKDNIGSVDLSVYTTIVMPNGRYRLSKLAAEKLREWLEAGGTLIAQKRANKWCVRNGLAQLTAVDVVNDERTQRPYGMLDRDDGARGLGGSIFNTKVDLSHPLLYGFQRQDMPSFHRGNLFYAPAQNAYATPIRYTDTPLLSGYVHSSSLEAIAGSANIIVSGKGSGRTISMMDEPAFRAFWFGTSKLLANAIFFGHTIDSDAREVVK